MENSNKSILKRRGQVLKKVKKSWQLYIFFSLPLAYYIIFHYIPMYGIQIAFKDFVPSLGIWGSPWIGFDHFKKFINLYDFKKLLLNTIGISVYSLVAGFPFPIILALALHNCEYKRFKSVTQTVTYAPHFISTVVMAGIIIQFLHPRVGVVNNIIKLLGYEPISFLSKPEYFKSIYVWSDIWQHAGWDSIIYLAALTSIDPTLHEAAIVDGASKWKRAIHIDLPGILPTAVILLILSMGDIISVGFEKVYLLQNPLNLESSEVISTYVYKVGIAAQIPQYAYSTAIGLFNSVVSFGLIVIVNNITKRISEISLW